MRARAFSSVNVIRVTKTTFQGAESTHAQRARSIGVASSAQLLSYLNSPSAHG